MTDFLKSIYRGNMIYAISLIVLGLVFAVWPTDSRQVLIKLLGVILALLGIAMGVLFFTRRTARLFPATLAIGVIVIVLGVLMFIKPETFIEFVIIVAGVFIGISGVLNFCQTLSLAMNRFPYWWVAMILSILTIVFAVLVITKPGPIADVVFIVTGIFMIADGLTDIWLARQVKQTTRSLRDRSRYDDAGGPQESTPAE